MVKISLLILLASAGSVCALKTLTQNEVQKAYYDSYLCEKSQDYVCAMKALYPILSGYQSGYTINFRMGWLSYLNGNYADALRFYKRALKIYPASIEVLDCISLVHKARNDWAKVEEQNFQIIKIDYFNQTANYWYAVALRERKKHDLAEKVCRKMLTLFPTSVWFLQELGQDLYFMKDYKQARAIFQSVGVLEPGNETAKKYLNLLHNK